MASVPGAEVVSWLPFRTTAGERADHYRPAAGRPHAFTDAADRLAHARSRQRELETTLDSPPQTLLFMLYHQIYRDALQDLLALLPEVWRHWDPKTVRARGKDAFLQFRMDFLIHAPAGARIVLEVEGQTHFGAVSRTVFPERPRPQP
jgi:hypothetical protein